MSNENPSQAWIASMANPDVAKTTEGGENFDVPNSAQAHRIHQQNADDVFAATQTALQATSKDDLDALNARMKATIFVNVNLQ